MGTMQIFSEIDIAVTAEQGLFRLFLVLKILLFNLRLNSVG